jgi:hypothetical protein
VGRPGLALEVRGLHQLYGDHLVRCGHCALLLHDLNDTHQLLARVNVQSYGNSG